MDECGYDTINSNWFIVEEFDERVLEFFDIDFRRVFLKGSSNYQKIIKEDGIWLDELGFTKRFSGGYSEMIDHPLRYAKDEEDIKKFKFYDASDPNRVKGLKEIIEFLYSKTD